MLSLGLDFDTDEYGGLVFYPSLTNTGDDEVSFSTASSLLFRVHVETTDGERVWTAGGLATQAFEYWTLAPGESVSQGSVWEHPSAYADIVERREESLDEYCERFDIEDWRNYEDETLVAVVESLGPDDAPVEKFEFTVSDDLPETEAAE